MQPSSSDEYPSGPRIAIIITVRLSFNIDEIRQKINNL